jgi:hypothetical protein
MSFPEPVTMSFPERSDGNLRVPHLVKSEEKRVKSKKLEVKSYLI